MGNPKKSIETPEGHQEVFSLEKLRKGAKNLDQQPGKEAMLALNALSAEKPILEQVDGWNTFRILLAKILWKVRNKDLDNFEKELEGQTLEGAIKRNPKLINTLAAKVELSPEESVALYKFNQFQAGSWGEISEQLSREDFWKEILIASKGGRWDQYQRLWKTDPEWALASTALVTFGAALLWRKLSKSETMKAWRAKRKAAKEEGSNWFTTGGILTIAGLGAAVMLAANWEKNFDKLLSVVGPAALWEMWKKIRNGEGITDIIRAEVDKRFEEAEVKASQKAEETKEDLKEMKEKIKESEMTQELKNSAEKVEEKSYQITTALFVEFAFFEKDMEGATIKNYLNQVIPEMKDVPLQELSEAVYINSDPFSQRIEAGYFKNIPESSTFNKYLDDYQRFLLCQRMVSFAKLSGLNETETIKTHFNKIAQNPLYQNTQEIHQKMLEKIRSGEWSEAFNINYKKIDEEFLEQQGEALLEYAQTALDPELTKKIEALDPEKELPVLRKIQFEMLRVINMEQMENGNPGPAVNKAIENAGLKPEEVTQKVRESAEFFMKTTYEQTGPLLEKIWDRYQIPNNPNHVKEGLTLEKIIFRHSLELVVASKEIAWGEEMETPEHWMKDLTLLHIVLKAMGKDQRNAFLADLAFVLPDKAMRQKIPFLAKLETYLDDMGTYVKTKLAQYAETGLGVTDSLARNKPFFADSVEDVYNFLALGAGLTEFLGVTPKEKDVRDLLKRVLDTDKENKRGLFDIFYDKDGLGWLVLSTANELFIVEPTGNAKEFLDRLFAEGTLSGTPEDFVNNNLLGAGETVASAVALPALLGFLANLRWYGGVEKDGKIWKFGLNATWEGVKGAGRWSLWKFHFMKWTGKKFVVVGEGIYNATLNKVENFTHTAKGIGKLSFTHRSFSSVVREAHFAEKHTQGFSLEKRLAEEAKASLPSEMTRDAANDLIHSKGRLENLGKRVARGAKNMVIKAGKWGWEKVKPAFNFGIHEELSFRRLNGVLDGINKTCGLFEEEHKYRMLGEYTEDEIDKQGKKPGQYTLEDLHKAREVERQFVSAVQKASQNSEKLRSSLLDVLRDIPESSSRNDAIAKIFAEYGFQLKQAYGLANQLKSEVQVNLMVDDLKRAGEVAAKLEVTRTPRRASSSPESALHPTEPETRTHSPQAAPEPHSTFSPDELHKAIEANQKHITEIQSKIHQQELDLQKAKEAYAKGGHPHTRSWIKTLETNLENLEKERTALIERNKLLVATKEIFDPNTTAEGLEKALKILQEEGQKLYQNFQINPSDAALKKAMIENGELLKNVHYRLQELQRIASNLTEATQGFSQGAETTGRWAKSLKFIRRFGGLSIASLGVFSIWETGKSTLNTFNSYKEGRSEQGYLNAGRTAMWGANAVVDTLGGAEILGTTFATQLPKLGKFAARNSVQMAGRVAVPLMVVTYAGEKIYDAKHEQTMSEGQWLKSASSYENLIHQWYSTANSTSLGDAWLTGFSLDWEKAIDKNLASKAETMRRIYKVLIALPESPELNEALQNGASAENLDKIINAHYTPYHDYFFSQLDPTRIQSFNYAKQIISEARTFNQIMQLRDVAEKMDIPFQVGEFDLRDKRYDTQTENFDPRAIVKAYREQKLGLSKEVSEKLSEGEKSVLKTLQNMSTPYLLRLYAQLSLAPFNKFIGQEVADETQKEIFEKYANLISNELELRRYITPSLEAAKPQFMEPIMKLEELSQHIENLQNGNSSSFIEYEKAHSEANPAVHALFRLAQHLGYTGDATEASLKLFFTEENADTYGIYWNAEQWIMQEAGWERDNVMGSSLHSKTIANMIQALKEGDVLEHRQDTLFVSAGEFDVATHNMAKVLEEGYKEGVEKYGPEKSMVERLKELAIETQR